MQGRGEGKGRKERESRRGGEGQGMGERENGREGETLAIKLRTKVDTTAKSRSIVDGWFSMGWYLQCSQSTEEALLQAS